MPQVNEFSWFLLISVYLIFFFLVYLKLNSLSCSLVSASNHKSYIIFSFALA